LRESGVQKGKAFRENSEKPLSSDVLEQEQLKKLGNYLPT
jgi:hypothetical protein